MSNAVKFSADKGAVEVRLERTREWTRLVVRDTGHGIEPEALPHIFDRFRQADSTVTRRHGGLGLGLAIVRHLVELHGGSVRAESPGPGQGATFTVELPSVATEDVSVAGPVAGPPDETSRTPRLDKLRVLFVDDHADTRELVRAVLSDCGAEVTVAASGLDALDMLARADVDVLVSDLGMPDLDGLALIARIRAGGSDLTALPALALTAHASQADQARALDAGFTGYVVKPVDPPDLVAAVGRVAGRMIG